jgi:hypothetical protein
MLPILIGPDELEMHYISAGDTVRLGVLAGPEISPVTVILESWDVAGSQPPNSHPHSTELFLFLRGHGLANCDGHEVAIKNTGDSRLYSITLMSPDDGFAHLVRRGPVAETDDEDRAVLSGFAGGSGGSSPRASTAARL